MYAISSNAQPLKHILTTLIIDMEHITLLLLLPIILMCTENIYVASFKMISHDEKYILDVGSQLTLHCEFYSDKFNLFENPVLWTKLQHGEETEINILGNIKKPFEATGRFNVTYQPDPPKHTMTLTIINVTEGDSGNYTCEIITSMSKPLGTINYTVFVRTQIDKMYVTQNTTTSPNNTLSTWALIENQASAVRCVARGGSPPPDLYIFIGGEDYTKYFSFQSHTTISGPASFRQTQVTSTLSTDDFRANYKHDGKQFNCIGRVYGVPKMVSTATMMVNYAPQIDCLSALACVGDRNVRLICEISSNPSLTSWHWVLDGNGTTISEGEVIDGFWTVVTKSDGKVKLELYMREATNQSFRLYTLVTENPVAGRSSQVILVKDNTEHHTIYSAPSGRNANILSSVKCNSYFIPLMIICGFSSLIV